LYVDRCECTKDFYGPECTAPLKCVVEGRCAYKYNTYCEVNKTGWADYISYQCTPVSELFFRHRYLNSKPTNDTSKICSVLECRWVIFFSFWLQENFY